MPVYPMPRGLELTVDDAQTKAVKWFDRNCGEGYHEPVVSSMIHDYAAGNPDLVFFDIGPLYGYYTLLVAGASKGRARIFSCELNPKTFGILEEVVNGSDLARGCVRCLNVALSDRDAQAERTLFSGMKMNPEGGAAEEEMIPHARMDTLCRSLGVRPDLVKVDIEGAEALFLAGAAETLADERVTLFLEIHSDEQLARFGTSQKALLETILASGKSVYSIGRKRNEVRKKDIHVLKPVRRDTMFAGKTRYNALLLTHADPNSLWNNVFVKPG